MRDAMGGTVTLFIISVFIVLALGYLAFNVNYTKAFRMKDKIISVYEKNRGVCGSACKTEIGNYADKIGYDVDNNLNYCPAGYKKSPEGRNYYCVKAVDANPNSSSRSISDRRKKCYYSVVTKVNIRIPIIDRLLNIDVFKVKGDTKSIEVEGITC